MTRYESQDCSVARTLDVVGDHWSILIIRDALRGVRRFDEFQRSLGVARNILAARLEKLVEHEILTRELYQERPPRYEYRPTERGLDLWEPLAMLMKWGDRHVSKRPPMLLEHRGCGNVIEPTLHCPECGDELTIGDLRLYENTRGKRRAAAAKV